MSRRRGAGAHTGRVLVGVLSLAGLLAALMQTVLVPLIADLPRLLETSSSNAAWAITSTLLSAAVTTPICGRLGDMYGKRRALLACLAFLVVGCLTCAVTTYLPVFLLGRVLQGASTGAIPLGMSILRDELRPFRVPSAIALLGATLGAGAALGIPAAAVVSQDLDWRLIFWSGAAWSALAFVLVLRHVPISADCHPAPFDFIGAAGLSAWLICLLLPITKGSSWGWASLEVVLLLAASATIFVMWIWFECRMAHPIVNIGLSASRPVLLTNIASVLTGFAMFSINLVLPQLLQAPSATGYGLNRSMVVAGLCMAPGGIVMLVLAPLAGRISTRAGPKVTLLSGLVVIVCDFGAANFMMSEVWQVLIISAVNGAGVGLVFGAMPALIMSVVPPSDVAAAVGINQLMRSIGTSASSAVLSLIMTSLVIALPDREAPTEMAIRWGLGVSAGVGILAIVVAWWIPTAPAAERRLAV